MWAQQWRRWRSWWHGRALGAERGASIVEELIAVTIVAVVAVTGLVALSTVSLGSAGQSVSATAETLLVAQAEEIKAAPFSGSYARISAPPAYTIAVSAPTSLAPGLQRLTVTVSHAGRQVRQVSLLKGER